MVFIKKAKNTKVFVAIFDSLLQKKDCLEIIILIWQSNFELEYSQDSKSNH